MTPTEELVAMVASHERDLDLAKRAGLDLAIVSMMRVQIDAMYQAAEAMGIDRQALRFAALSFYQLSRS